MQKLLVLVLLSVALSAQAQKPDLEGAELREHGMCMYNGQPLPCAVYEKEGVKYLLYAGGREIVMIYRVKAGASMPYGPNELTLLWSLGEKKKVTV